MTVTQAIEERRSIRKYSEKEVPRELIEKIIRAAALAPSAKNRQPWKFIVYTGKAKEKLVDAMNAGVKREILGNMAVSEFRFGLADAKNTATVMKQAPVLILILNTENTTPFKPSLAAERITEISNTLSIGAAVQNLILSAEESGLGTLFITNTCFAYAELEKAAGTSDQIAGFVALGYAAESPYPRPRKPFETICRFAE